MSRRNRFGDDRDITSPREVAGGPQRGRRMEHMRDPRVGRNVENAGHPAHMQHLSQMAGENIRPSNSREEVTESPPTPRLASRQPRAESPPLLDLTEPPSLTLSTAEETATEEMLSAARLRLDSLPSRPTDSLRSGPTEGGLAWIAEEEFNITKTFLESHSTSVTHEQFMHSMLQAHDQSDPFEKMVIYNRLLSSIHPRIEHEPPPQQNEGVALPPPKRKRRKNKDFTAHASGSAVRDEDLDVLSGF